MLRPGQGIRQPAPRRARRARPWRGERTLRARPIWRALTDSVATLRSD